MDESRNFAVGCSTSNLNIKKITKYICSYMYDRCHGSCHDKEYFINACLIDNTFVMHIIYRKAVLNYHGFV